MAKLQMNTELGIVAVLILLTVFYPNLLRQVVASPVGKVVALGAVAYVWKTYSKLVAFFLAVAVLHAMCKPGFEYMCKTDKSTKAECEDKENGGHWDDSQAVGKKCKC